MSQRYHLTTPEAIALSYDVAGLGSRALALVIDYLILLGASLLLVLGAVAWRRLGGDATVGDIALATLLFLLWLGYFMVFETLWEGQTPGKRLLKLRVLKTTGYPIDLSAAVIRNLVRLADMLPAFYTVGVLVMFVSPQSRRLGDYAASTVVVKERREQLPPAAPLPAAIAQDPDEAHWQVWHLSEEDMAVVRAFVQRAPSLPGEARYRLGTDLANRVASRIGARQPYDAPQFLARVLVRWEEEGGA